MAGSIVLHCFRDRNILRVNSTCKFKNTFVARLISIIHSSALHAIMFCTNSFYMNVRMDCHVFPDEGTKSAKEPFIWCHNYLVFIRAVDHAV